MLESITAIITFLFNKMKLLIKEWRRKKKRDSSSYIAAVDMYERYEYEHEEATSTVIHHNRK